MAAVDALHACEGDSVLNSSVKLREMRSLRRAIWRSKSCFWRKLLRTLKIRGACSKVMMSKISRGTSSLVEVLATGTMRKIVQVLFSCQ